MFEVACKEKNPRNLFNIGKTEEMHGSFQLCSIFLYTPQGLNLLPMSSRNMRYSMGLNLQLLAVEDLEDLASCL